MHDIQQLLWYKFKMILFYLPDKVDDLKSLVVNNKTPGKALVLAFQD